MMFLEKGDLHFVLDVLAGLGKLYVPAESNGITRFVPYGGEKTQVWLQTNTAISPKEILFPATETLYRYETGRGKETVKPVADHHAPLILFGIRSCDLQAITCLDDVFLDGEFVDELYRERRETATIIALSCAKAGPHCFCQSMGLDPLAHRQSDLQMYDYDQYYGLEANSDRGRLLLETLEKHDLLSVSGRENPVPALEFALEVETEGITEKLTGMFEHPLWEEVASKCLNCGICTYLCPACHCFDISEKLDNAHCGSKIRCWDSCMFSGYTRMAGGHNPRPGKRERVRERFMHKLCYFPQRYGKYLCTGCGRCLAKCPVGLEITKIMELVKEVENDA
ncbi:MAG: 4Fe-4S dicluster domain-containing protein [Desulfitobacteriaceae bacterium]|nr:4Fe-4S dicluster domain-containing protein [Desulfitobacteriaceae bacterium]MDI6914293.1 4Fe-4S dicluster domain-containing protein [Desulfitobacteriaceae bacterium]